MELIIQSNPRLASLDALEALTSVGETLTIRNNAALTTLSGLDALTRVGGDLYITDSARLTSLHGLGALTRVGRSIFIERNPSLTTTVGLGGFASVDRHLSLYDNPRLTSLQGLRALSIVGGELYIGGNIALPSLDGLSKLQSVGEEVYIDNNPLQSLEGLSALESTGSLTIQRIAPLTSLKGLDALKRVRGDLYIGQNSMLTDCACGLKGLATETAPGVFTFIGVSRSTSISYNGSATCSTPQAALSAMPACPSDTDVEQQERIGFALAGAQPNPTRGASVIRFSLEAPGQTRLSVFDVLGREVARPVDGTLAAGLHTASLDAFVLPSGLYVYRLESGSRWLTGALTVAR